MHSKTKLFPAKIDPTAQDYITREEDSEHRTGVLFGISRAEKKWRGSWFSDGGSRDSDAFGLFDAFGNGDERVFLSVKDRARFAKNHVEGFAYRRKTDSSSGSDR